MSSEKTSPGSLATTNTEARTATASPKIWVILRCQGEYSDRSVCCACWFPSKVAAETFIAKAQGQSRDAAQRWRKIEDGCDGELPDGTYEKFIAELKLLDTSFNPTDYDADGVYYYAAEVARGTLTSGETAKTAAGA